MLRSIILVFSYWCIFRFVLVIGLELLSMIIGELPFSIRTIGSTIDGVSLSLLVGLFGIYVTRQK